MFDYLVFSGESVQGSLLVRIFLLNYKFGYLQPLTYNLQPLTYSLQPLKKQKHG